MIEHVIRKYFCCFALLVTRVKFVMVSNTQSKSCMHMVLGGWKKALVNVQFEHGLWKALLVKNLLAKAQILATMLGCYC